MIKNLTCMQQHDVKFYSSDKKVPRPMEMFHLDADKVCCDACKTAFSRQERGGSYSCSQDCDFDLCSNCAVCENGHLLKERIVRDSSLAEANPICNRCGKEISSHETCGVGISWCDICNTAICRACIPKVAA